jgi:ABC-type Fe3+ transport system permease subunit
MDHRTITAAVLALVTLLCIVGALLYATRARRAAGREHRRSEKSRRARWKKVKAGRGAL